MSRTNNGVELINQSQESGSCDGCYFYKRGDCGALQERATFLCSPDSENDGLHQIWVKPKKEESPSQAPTQKGVTIQEVRTKTLELKNKIYELIQEFEDDTKMVVRGLDLAHTQEIGGASSIYGVKLDVRLN